MGIVVVIFTIFLRVVFVVEELGGEKQSTFASRDFWAPLYWRDFGISSSLQS
jgi:hypothetical protein